MKPTFIVPHSSFRNSLRGWLFDIDDLGPAVTLWVYDDDGRLHRLSEEFRAPVYARGERTRLKQLAADFARRGWITGVRWAERREFWSGDATEVLQLNVADSASQRRICEMAAQIDREVTFYDLDIPATQHFPAIAQERDSTLQRPLGNGFDLQDLLAQVARHYLIRAMAEAHDNKTDAAKLVGLPSYQTLTNWLKKYNVESGQ